MKSNSTKTFPKQAKVGKSSKTSTNSIVVAVKASKMSSFIKAKKNSSNLGKY